MKKFYIVANPDKENTKNMQAAIEKYLKAHGAGVSLGKSVSGHGNPYTDPEEVPADTECVITLGGDGTLIQAARDLAGRNLPMIGINLGGLGYLTQTGREGDVKELLDALLEDCYELQERMMLKGCVYRNARPVKESIALNDIVLTRDGDPRVLKLKLYVDGQFLNEFSADGMIVATPTGSTAYNLSAGGPIAQPDGQLMILTPICPHSMQNRSIVFSAEDQIRIEVEERREPVPAGGIEAIFDGGHQITLKAGDRVEIVHSEKTTGIIKLHKESFLEILNKKLGES